MPPQGREGCRSGRPCLPRTCGQAPEGASASVAGRLSARPDFLCAWLFAEGQKFPDLGQIDAVQSAVTDKAQLV